MYGESINDLQKIEKMLRFLSTNFDYIIVSIEEFKNIAEMKLEEIKASLEAHEMILKQINLERDQGGWTCKKVHQEIWKGKREVDKKSSCS